MNLRDHGYAALLGDGADRSLVHAIIREPDIGPRLQRIINDRTEPWQERFLASEILFRFVELQLHRQSDPASLDEAYFEALRNNYTGNGADWGFTKDPNDPGPLARMVLDWNHDGGAFVRGLDDQRVVTTDFRWGEPPYEALPYRVKDFAALIVSRARGIDLDLSGTPGDRDRAIAGLRATVSR